MRAAWPSGEQVAAIGLVGIRQLLERTNCPCDWYQRGFVRDTAVQGSERASEESQERVRGIKLNGVGRRYTA